MTDRRLGAADVGRARPRPFAMPLAAAAFAVILGACSGSGTSAATVEPTASNAAVTPSASAAAASPSPALSASAEPSPSALPASPVVGVVTAVRSAGLTKVESFTIRTDAGEMLTFQVGPLAPDSFPPGHLTEHAATGEPIQVTFRVEGDALVATDLSDAP